MTEVKKEVRIVYQIADKEQEQLKKLISQLANMQNAFFDIITFIGQRENVNFQQVTFDQDQFAFVEKEVAKKE